MGIKRQRVALDVIALMLVARETVVTVIVFGAWAVTSDPSGWFSGWRRADSRVLCRSGWA